MQACEKRITENMIRQHKTEVHPKVRWQRWAKLSYKTRAEKAKVTRFNASIAHRVQAKSDIMAGFLSFRWPTRFGPKRQRVSPVSFRPAWMCRTCLLPCRTDKIARGHQQQGCQEPDALRLKWAKARLKALANTRSLFRSGVNSGNAKKRGLQIFDDAQQFFERSLKRQEAGCF